MTTWMTKWRQVVAIAIVAALPGVSTAQNWTSPLPSDKVDGGVNWTRMYLSASATGVAPPNAQSPEHGRALAITAATVLARQELLAIARGVAIDGQTTVQALMVTNATTQARVAGVIRGAQVIATKDLGGGSWEVTVAVPATGEFADLVIPQAPAPRPPAPVIAMPAPTPPTPAPIAPPRPLEAIYTGLVIDARGLGIKPVMTPKVLSEGGQEVYGRSVVDRNFVIQQGMAGYSKEIAAAQANDRVANRPLTVKALAAAGAGKADVVISNADAQMLLGAGQNLAFLEKARVMLVVD